MAFKLPAKIVKAREALHGQLEEFISDARMEWDEKSERWQESDKGEAVTAWLDELETFCDSLEDAEELNEPEEG